MSEETQEIKEQKAPDTAEKSEAPAEAAPATPAGEAPVSEGAGKTKKINRISPEELAKKIKVLEEQNQIHSKYYKHLVQRKNEVERSKA